MKNTEKPIAILSNGEFNIDGESILRKLRSHDELLEALHLIKNTDYENKAWFNYTQEQLIEVIKCMAETANEAIQKAEGK